MPQIDLAKFKSQEFLNILVLLRNSLWDETMYESVIEETNQLILEIERYEGS
jgi:hypothetical protein